MLKRPASRAEENTLVKSGQRPNHEERMSVTLNQEIKKIKKDLVDSKSHRIFVRQISYESKSTLQTIVNTRINDTDFFFEILNMVCSSNRSSPCVNVSVNYQDDYLFR